MKNNDFEKDPAKINIILDTSGTDPKEVSAANEAHINSMRALSRLGASFKDQMSQAAQSFKQWLSVSSGVMLKMLLLN